ncbi:MAG: LtrC-like protein [Anaerolineae bacterium]|nr:MAG: LtrC-like protein [Anaerolineae bacterium]
MKKEKAKVPAFDEILERLVEMSEEAFRVQFLDYLKCMANFWNYSFSNTILIASQFPNATRVAGIKTWNKLGRRVKKGEKGIAILVPVIARIEKNQEASEEADDIDDADDENREENLKTDTVKEVVVRFRIGYVFDISQTEGEPLPELKWWNDGDAPSALVERITSAIRQDGIEIAEAEKIHYGKGNARGLSLGGKIVVLKDTTPLSKASTLIHEWAHEYRKACYGDSQAGEEVIAEAVAYVVLSHFGLSPDNSAIYIASWQRDKQLLKERLQMVKELSAVIIGKIEKASDI